MLRLLRTRRWLTWLAVAAVWAVLCVYAGFWQWHRWQDKSTVQHRIEKNYDATPEPLASVLQDGRPPAVEDEWKQVSATGTYVGSTILVRNRPGPEGDFGYEVLNVFRTGTNEVLVDRGWVANGANAATPASVPDAPRGSVTVTGWVRPSERDLNRRPVPGQVSSVSVSEVERTTGRNLVDGYVRMRSEKVPSGAAVPRPTALDKPSQGMAAGINLSYALQWWLGAIAGFAFVLMRARREHLDMLEAESDGAALEAAQGDGAPDDADRDIDGTGMRADEPTRVNRKPKPPKRPKPRKTRIWDEEDA